MIRNLLDRDNNNLSETDTTCTQPTAPSQDEGSVVPKNRSVALEQI